MTDDSDDGGGEDIEVECTLCKNTISLPQNHRGRIVCPHCPEERNQKVSWSEMLIAVTNDDYALRYKCDNCLETNVFDVVVGRDTDPSIATWVQYCEHCDADNKFHWDAGRIGLAGSQAKRRDLEPVRPDYDVWEDEIGHTDWEVFEKQ